VIVAFSAMSYALPNRLARSRERARYARPRGLARWDGLPISKRRQIAVRPRRVGHESRLRVALRRGKP
jgi:hypothetical protein